MQTTGLYEECHQCSRRTCETTWRGCFLHWPETDATNTLFTYIPYTDVCNPPKKKGKTWPGKGEEPWKKNKFKTRPKCPPG